jgi:hypothetical protein
MKMIVKKFEKNEYINPPKVEAHKQIQKDTFPDDFISEDQELNITFKSNNDL